MTSQSFYPMVLTRELVKTINFYEDYFDFIPELEMDCFVVLRHAQKEMRIGLIDANHHSIPQEYQRPAQGLILSLPVDNVQDAFEALYNEGLRIHHEPCLAACGRRHFLVSDPNGVLIDVMETFEPFEGIESLGHEKQFDKENEVILN